MTWAFAFRRFIHTSAENLARSAVLTAEMFGYDAAIVPYDMCTVPEALGRGASLYEHSDDILYPTVPSKWATLDDVEIPEDFLGRGRMPLVDEAIHLIKSQTNGVVAIGGWVLGPFTMAGQIVELDLLLKGVFKHKAQTEAFIDKMTHLVIRVAQHYQELGVDYMTIREMGTGSDLLSPRVWKTLIQPNLSRRFSTLSRSLRSIIFVDPPI
jgi:[methyl-Co(III) methanol-specific corrinoid protein]:coenzyme M methyltransferase